MKFEFKINRYYLVGHAMASKNKPFPAWIKLEEKIWRKYREEPAYYFLNPKHIKWALGQMQINFSNKKLKSEFLKNALILEKIYKEIFKTKEFKRLYRETEKYLEFTKNQWNKNEKEVLAILQNVSGLPTPKQRISIYIVHPRSEITKTINESTIIRGRKERWKNHTTIGFCHELMHIMTWPGHFRPSFDILHAIIMLADNEIKIRLNKKGEYFKEKEIDTEPTNFINLEQKFLPFWKKYLNNKLNNIKNIMQFKKYITKILKK